MPDRLGFVKVSWSVNSMGNTARLAVLPNAFGTSTIWQVYLDEGRSTLDNLLDQKLTMARDRTIPVPPPSAPAPSGILRVSGDQIVSADGKPVILRGAGLGGHLNMENFITGYPGHEHEMRRAMKAALGEEKYDIFFDKVWVSETRICSVQPRASTPFLTCTLLLGDKTPVGIASLFWEHIEFQNRAIALWEALAARYKGNTWVAGYNPLNEPCDEEHTRMLAWYDRVEKLL
ncbi:hypothetical protein FRB90_007351, partial [Tulasnella sp. 427]